MEKLTLANLNNFSSSGQYRKYKRNGKKKLFDAEGCKKNVYMDKRTAKAILGMPSKRLYFLYKSGKEKVPWKDCQEK